MFLAARYQFRRGLASCVSCYHSNECQSLHHCLKGRNSGRVHVLLNLLTKPCASMRPSYTVWRSLLYNVRRNTIDVKHLSDDVASSSLPQPMSKDQNYSYIPGVQLENNYFRSYLEASAAHRDKLLTDDVYRDPESRRSTSSTNIDVGKLVSSDVITEEYFDTLSDLAQLPHTEFSQLELPDTLVTRVMMNLRGLTDAQFFRFLSLVTSPNIISAMYRSDDFTYHMSELMNTECFLRCESWTQTRDWFKPVDFFYKIGTLKSASVTYIEKFSSHILANLNEISPSEVVVFMYQMVLRRRLAHQMRDATGLDITISRIGRELTPDEMAIVCLGYFKTRTVTRNVSILEIVNEKLLQIDAHTSSIAIGAFFKFLRHATRTNEKFQRYETRNMLMTHAPATMRRLEAILDSVSFISLGHALEYYSQIRFMDGLFLRKVVEHILAADLSDLRSKDLAKLMLNLGHFLPKCDSVDGQRRGLVCKKLREELRSASREREFTEFPDALLLSLIGMSFMDVYDYDLLKLMFSQPVINKALALKTDQIRTLYYLSESVRIERPRYPGPHLSVDLLKGLAKDHQIFGLPKNVNSTRERIMREFRASLETLLPPTMYELTFVLPHYQIPDIEIHLDALSRPIPVKLWKSPPNTQLSSDFIENSQNMPQDGETKLVIVFLMPNYYWMYKKEHTDKTGKRLLGKHVPKSRQLRVLGYKVVEIPYNAYNFQDDKKLYLQEMLKKHMVMPSNRYQSLFT